MNILEFETIINNNIINIPKSEEFIGKKAWVFIVDLGNKETKKEDEDFIEFFSKNPINLPKDTKF